MLWNVVYETGVSIIDAQHKELFDQIDTLLDKSNVNRIPATLSFLGNYVVRHFSTEEDMQGKVKYPKASEHRQMHQNFIQTYKGLEQEFSRSGESPMVVIKISNTALAWLKEHIRVQDKEWTKYYTEHMPQTAGARA